MAEKNESIPLIDSQKPDTKVDKAPEKTPVNDEASDHEKQASTENLHDKSSVKECVADLDALVEKWIDYMYTTTNVPKKSTKCFKLSNMNKKTKESRDLKDYDVEIDWSNVSFKQEETVFDSSKVSVGNSTSQTLLQTSFVNRTSQEQESSFKMERTTTQVCEFAFDKGFKSNQSPGFSLLIPQDIANVDASIKRERNLVAGKNVVAKEEVTWKCDSKIRVKPHSTTHGSLVITEMELDRTFKGVVYIKGRLFCKLRIKNEEAMQAFSADMSQIIDLAFKNKDLDESNKTFEIVDGQVKTNFSGQCKFRLGYNQRVELKEEDLSAE